MPLPSHRYKTVTAALCAVWLAAVTFIVLWPTPVDRAGGGRLRRGLAFLHDHGLPAFVTYSSVEFMSNVVMFVPFGLSWFILAPRAWRWAGPLAGMGLSIIIELTQLVLLPQRFATPQDVIANTFGSVIGSLLGWALLQLRTSGRTR